MGLMAALIILQKNWGSPRSMVVIRASSSRMLLFFTETINAKIVKYISLGTMSRELYLFILSV